MTLSAVMSKKMVSFVCIYIFLKKKNHAESCELSMKKSLVTLGLDIGFIPTLGYELTVACIN